MKSGGWGVTKLKVIKLDVMKLNVIMLKVTKLKVQGWCLGKIKR